MALKKKLRDGVSASLKLAKRTAGRSKTLKRIARNLILENLTLEVHAQEWSSYQRWFARHNPDAIAMAAERNELKKLTYQPLISILTPTYNTDLEHLRECIQSVQSQTYQNWQLCIVDDASPNEEVRSIIEEFAKADERIAYSFRKQNGHISAASNDALKLAKGEFIGLLDHDDILWPNALFEVVKALNADQQLDFLYSDEDKIHRDRFDHQHPFFKPDWNPEFLESVNYITHFAVLRKKLIEQVGGFRSEYDGAQDWDLFLRAGYATTHIHHIPTVLYSWRMSETSTASSTEAKPYVRNSQQAAIEESLRVRGQRHAEVTRGMSRDYWTVVYPPPKTAKVSIVIPTKNQLPIVKRCVQSIVTKTTFRNYEVILVDTGSTDAKVFNWYKAISSKHPHIKVVDWPEQPFSYARACNFGASQATGDYLVMLNNDTEVLTPNWLELLLSDAQRDGVGAVGCKLYYPDGKHIQHAGTGVGLGGFAANLLSPLLANQLTVLQHLYANTRHELSAVTAACLMIKKSRFDEVDGFDEQFRVTYNDVDLCLRLNQAGYRTIYNPSIELLHHESISVGLPHKSQRDNQEFKAAQALFKKRWQAVITHDPHLNPNLSKDNANLEPRTN